MPMMKKMPTRRGSMPKVKPKGKTVSMPRVKPKGKAVAMPKAGRRKRY